MKTWFIVVGLVTVTSAVGAAQAADPAAGKAKAAVCAGCHGANGEGSGANPPLAGVPEDKFVQSLKDYKSGKRANAVMKNFAGPLSDADMANLAAFYASLNKK
jgi:cytochrome c553